ncbi:MAG TPA: hypothetical protein H9839_07215, partial [Candidatus Intestinimonas stercorigallinarum]|nr:hypothetical protein [Candidatus Intestinimonas stercorigallinarum]
MISETQTIPTSSLSLFATPLCSPERQPSLRGGRPKLPSAALLSAFFVVGVAMRMSDGYENIYGTNGQAVCPVDIFIFQALICILAICPAVGAFGCRGQFFTAFRGVSGKNGPSSGKRPADLACYLFSNMPGSIQGNQFALLSLIP